MDYLQVEGHEQLGRDPISNSVVNTDAAALEKAKARKQQLLNKDSRISKLEDEVKSLHSKLDQIIGFLANEKNNG